MKQLSKEQNKTLHTLNIDAQATGNDLEVAITKYNEILADIKLALDTALNAHNEKLTELRDFSNDIVSEIQEYMDERSDKWQESENGERYAEWKSSWEDLEFEHIEIDTADELEPWGPPENFFESVDTELP